MLTINKVHSQTELDQCLKLRRQVFILEQKVPEHEEYDSLDQQCLHFIAYENQHPVGTARLLVSEHKVQRVAVLKEYRHLGVGRKLMEAIEQEASALGLEFLKLGAQLSALRFYEKLGYQAYGDVFLDANIEHRFMKKQL